MTCLLMRDATSRCVSLVGNVWGGDYGCIVVVAVVVLAVVVAYSCHMASCAIYSTKNSC